MIPSKNYYTFVAIFTNQFNYIHMKKLIFIFFLGALFLGGYAQKPTSWELTGNTGTNPPSHFIGTTDCEPLIFKTDRIERMRLITKTALGIGTTAPQALLHLQQPKFGMDCASIPNCSQKFLGCCNAENRRRIC